MIEVVESVRSRIILPREERWIPKSMLGKSIAKALPFLPEALAAEVLERARRAVVMESELRLTVLRGFGQYLAGAIPWEAVALEEYGVVSRKVVTNNGVGYIVDAFQNSTELENMKFHGIGTGSTAEAAGDSALVTELTTEYNPNSTRATGTTAETSSNIFQTVATNTLDSGTPNLREHGVFSASSAGVLLDRSVFAGIALDGTAGDALQSDYRLTLTAGS